MRLLRLLLVAFALLAVIPAAASAGPHDAFPLQPGSAGPRVCDAQWLLMGKRPGVYRGASFRVLQLKQPNCLFGPRTAAAAIEMKRRLGFPKHAQTARFGRDVREILLGKRARPLGYVVRAARIKAASTRPATPARLTYGARAIRIAQGELGCREIPDGSNYSACIHKYQAVTGAFRAPWCASWTAWVYLTAGIGTFANRSAHVFTIVNWARQRGLVRTYPRPGWLVGFLDRLGHIALVERVDRSGFSSIEGNSSNQVIRRYHPLSNYRPKIYIAIPGVDVALP